MKSPKPQVSPIQVDPNLIEKAKAEVKKNVETEQNLKTSRTLALVGANLAKALVQIFDDLDTRTRSHYDEW
jgi:hypothetical protein